MILVKMLAVSAVNGSRRRSGGTICGYVGKRSLPIYPTPCSPLWVGYCGCYIMLPLFLVRIT